MDKEPFEEVNPEVNSSDESINESIEQSEKVSSVSSPVVAGTFNWRKELLEWVEAIVIAVVLALIIRTFVFNLVKVDGNSMLPTLHHEDRLFVWKLGYVPRQGDIIIFRPKAHKDTPYVKRVIAVPGQTVDIDFKNHIVKVDGEVLDEDYIYEPTANPGNMEFPLTVEPNTVFVLGDNRNNSRDSRFKDVGLVSYDSIIGKAVFRIWPLKSFGLLNKK